MIFLKIFSGKGNDVSDYLHLRFNQKFNTTIEKTQSSGCLVFVLLFDTCACQ